MGHEDLKQVGVSAYGFRHKILKGIAQLRATAGQSSSSSSCQTICKTNYLPRVGFGLTPNPGTLLVELATDDKEFLAVEEEMQATIRDHRDNGQSGGFFSRYNMIRVSVDVVVVVLHKFNMNE